MSEGYSAIPVLSKKSQQVRNWVYEHYDELVKSYPNQWVAVVDKKVISYGKNLGEVEKISKDKTGENEIFTIFVEKGIHVYYKS